MKLVSFRSRSEAKAKPRIGVLLPDANTVADLQTTAQHALNAPLEYFVDMLAFLEGGQEAHDQAARLAERATEYAATHPVNTLVLLAPVPRPRSLRDVMGFPVHIHGAIKRAMESGHVTPEMAAQNEMFRAAMQRPLYYFSNTNSVTGHDSDIIIPTYTQRMDYELEFGVYIGTCGKNIAAKDAHRYIAGYTIYNDLSARDIQFDEMVGMLGPAKGKSFDCGNAMGPYLVTADEITDPYALAMIARVNDEEWTRSNSSDQYWRYEETLEYISRSETLYPGDFIASGTCSRGCGLELGKFLKAGDVVELEVEGLGMLRNRVVVSDTPFAPVPLRDPHQYIAEHG
ncbi:fumarylacetoacetate hydrolase family protein [Paraburkholderia metrosideri]|uniref:Fumarylacetoacetate hydrolase family protein n=1 Tax=Paraburkholderia metrosideri TaxID=580937 RepID=A0ABW9E2R2_9BURK